MILLFLYFIVLLGVFFTALWYALNFKYILHLRKLPGPTPLPIVGNIPPFSSLTEALPRMMELQEKYGTLYVTRMGFRKPTITISDPKFLSFLLGTTKVLSKSPEYGFLSEWLGTGLLTSTGSKWFKHRKIITPAFHFKILESFVEIFEKNVEILLQKWSQKNGTGNFDVYPYITLLTLDIISETALGTTINAQLDTHSDYVRAVKKMGQLIMQRAVSLYLSNDFLYNFSKEKREEKESLRILHEMTKSVIRKRRQQLQESSNPSDFDEDEEGMGIRKKRAFLDLLLQATVDGRSLTDNELMDEVNTFMFEGHDTTASAISFALYNLSNHQEVQRKVFSEIKDIFESDFQRKCNYADLQEMKYLEAVIKETLRLYPPVPLFGRVATEDFNYDDITIPKGTNLSVFAFGLLRDPNIFPEPEKFNPDRFLEDRKEVKDPFAYVPFSAGPRNCIGQKFAMLEMKSTISNILKTFELLPSNEDLCLSPETTLKSSNGIKLQIRRRR